MTKVTKKMMAAATEIVRKAEVKKTEIGGNVVFGQSPKNMTFDSAVALAARKHQGQKDLGGSPYILHLFHIANAMFEKYGEEMAIAGVLHDILEDTSITYDDLLKMQVPKRACHAILAVTRGKGKETYREYIERLWYSQDASALKVADLLHNLDFNRLSPELVYRYRSLFTRQRRALHYLQTGSWK